MDIKEKRTLFIEFLGRIEYDEEFYNSDVRGERSDFRLISFRDIGSITDLRRMSFPEDCIAYRLKYLVEVFNNGNLTSRAYTQDLTGIILRALH